MTLARAMPPISPMSQRSVFPAQCEGAGSPCGWWYALGDRQLGPVSLQGLAERYAQGFVGRENLVWTQGMRNWIALGALASLREELVEALRSHLWVAYAPLQRVRTRRHPAARQFAARVGLSSVHPTRMAAVPAEGQRIVRKRRGLQRHAWQRCLDWLLGWPAHATRRLYKN